jgi:hypothetical protein
MTDIFEPNWVEKIPFNYNEIYSIAKVDKWQNLPSHIFENRTVPIDIEQATWESAKKAQP